MSSLIFFFFLVDLSRHEPFFLYAWLMAKQTASQTALATKQGTAPIILSGIKGSDSLTTILKKAKVISEKTGSCHVSATLTLDLTAIMKMRASGPSCSQADLVAAATTPSEKQAITIVNRLREQVKASKPAKQAQPVFTIDGNVEID